MFEIKVLFCAHIGCTGSKNRAPGSLSVCSSLYKGIDILENACTHRVHRFEKLHPAAKTCTQGAGCAPLISNTDLSLLAWVFSYLNVT